MRAAKELVGRERNRVSQRPVPWSRGPLMWGVIARAAIFLLGFSHSTTNNFVRDIRRTPRDIQEKVLTRGEQSIK